MEVLLSPLAGHQYSDSLTRGGHEWAQSRNVSNDDHTDTDTPMFMLGVHIISLELTWTQ